MKKAFVMALALVLTLSLAVPASAASTGSPVAPTVSDTTTAPLPEVVDVKAEDDSDVIVELIPVEDITQLTEEEVKNFKAAQEKLAEATPAGMKVQYFNYVKVLDTDGKPVNTSVSITIRLPDATKVVAMQFIDGKWVELKVTLNPDGTFTIHGVVDGPLAIFTV